MKSEASIMKEIRLMYREVNMFIPWSLGSRNVVCTIILFAFKREQVILPQTSITE